MKRISIIILSFFMFTFFSSFLGLFFGSSLTPSTKMAHRITKEIGKILKSKYGLHFMGISEEGPDGKYVKIGFELSYKKILTQDQGRKLLLDCARDVLYAFNSKPIFEKYMANVPFTYDNIIINIYVQPSHDSDVFALDIGVFSFYNDTLWYSRYSQSERFKSSTEKESLEEAKKIVEAQMNSH